MHHLFFPVHPPTTEHDGRPCTIILWPSILECHCRGLEAKMTRQHHTIHYNQECLTCGKRPIQPPWWVKTCSPIYACTKDGILCVNCWL